MKLRLDKALSDPKDLRAYLQKLIEYDPRQLMIVDKEIDPIFEVTAIVDQMRTDARYPNYPAVLFRKIKGSSIPLLINLQGTYERLALAIDSNLQGMVEEFGRRENAPVPVKRVDRAQAPVKEVVWKGRRCRCDQAADTAPSGARFRQVHHLGGLYSARSENRRAECRHLSLHAPR